MESVGTNAPSRGSPPSHNVKMAQPANLQAVMPANLQVALKLGRRWRTKASASTKAARAQAQAQARADEPDLVTEGAGRRNSRLSSVSSAAVPSHVASHAPYLRHQFAAFMHALRALDHLSAEARSAAISTIDPRIVDFVIRRVSKIHDDMDTLRAPKLSLCASPSASSLPAVHGHGACSPGKVPRSPSKALWTAKQAGPACAPIPRACVGRRGSAANEALLSREREHMQAARMQSLGMGSAGLLYGERSNSCGSMTLQQCKRAAEHQDSAANFALQYRRAGAVETTPRTSPYNDSRADSPRMMIESPTISEYGSESAPPGAR